MGIILVKVAVIDLTGGFKVDDFDSTENLLLGFTFLVIVIALNTSKHPMIRLSAIFLSMLAGCIIAWWQGLLSFDNCLVLPLFSFPEPFKYGNLFQLDVFIPVVLVYFLSAIETSGDLTANNLFCNQPIKKPLYLKCIKGGILTDGFHSLLATMFNNFPNTTFDQDNAAIQNTGVASYHLGVYVTGFLVLLGLFSAAGTYITDAKGSVRWSNAYYVCYHSSGGGEITHDRSNRAPKKPYYIHINRLGLRCYDGARSTGTVATSNQRHYFFLVYSCRLFCNNYESIYTQHTQHTQQNIKKRQKHQPLQFCSKRI